MGRARHVIRTFLADDVSGNWHTIHVIGTAITGAAVGGGPMTPACPHSLRTVDGRAGIITDTYATPANVHDSIVYLGRLDRQRQRFGFDVGAVGLDAGYATSGIAKGLEDRRILGVTGYRRSTPPRPSPVEERLASPHRRGGQGAPRGPSPSN